MLKEKTKGNLGSAEEEFLNKVLFELQMNYVDELKADRKENTTSGSGEASTEAKDEAGESDG
jgi:hypothetical protein